MVDERQRHIDHLRFCERAARAQAERNLPHDTPEYQTTMAAKADHFARKAAAVEGYGVIDDLHCVLTGPHPLRLAGAAALIPDLTPAGLLALLDGARKQGREDAEKGMPA